DVRLLLLEHVAEVGVDVLGAEPLLRREPARLVLVGDGDDLHVVEALPDDVQAMAVVAAAGPADHRHTVLSGHESAPEFLLVFYRNLDERCLRLARAGPARGRPCERSA